MTNVIPPICCVESNFVDIETNKNYTKCRKIAFNQARPSKSWRICAFLPKLIKLEESTRAYTQKKARFFSFAQPKYDNGTSPFDAAARLHTDRN